MMPKGMELPESEVVIVVTPSYFEGLAEVLNTTSKRTIANYFMWRSVIVASNFLNDQVRIRKVAYMSAMSGGVNGQPGQGGTTQWKECITYTTQT